MDDSYFLIIIIAIFFVILTIYKLLVGNDTIKEVLPYKLADAIPTNYKSSNYDDIVEVDLIASEKDVRISDDIETTVYTYNNMFPGPVIEGRVGQKLIINFTNQLLVPTSLIFYGYPVAAGTNSLGQKAVLPGETIKYAFKLDIPGVYIYRSNSSAIDQVSNGLYGALIVHDHIQNNRLGLPLEYHVLVISDLWVDTVINKQHIYLVNGVYEGVIEIERNVAQRLYILNTSIDTVFRISLSNHDMLKIGGDQGLIESPLVITGDSSISISPGERLDIVFTPKDKQISIDHTISSNASLETVKLGTFKCLNTGRRENLHIPLYLKNIPKIKLKGDETIIPVTYIQKDRELYAAYNDIPYHYLNDSQIPVLKINKVYIFEISNRTHNVQNFHINGFYFQHLYTTSLYKRGKIYKPKNVENKDTLIIPPDSLAVVAVKLRNYGRKIKTNNSKWHFGTNFLYFADKGMKGYFKIL